MDLEQITRDIFRIPVHESHDVSALIENQSFPVINLGSKGIGILLNEEDAFPVSDQIFTITLHLGGKQFELKGKIVHVSPHDSGNYLCGVELVGLTHQCEKTIADYIKKHRSSMFTE
ncbi:MAG: PilZ domain-containing protein [Desulfobulbaceae bacterium]|nr:PilZ domain-containing protein [Desulfobulbaceae bacterium]